MRVFRFFLQIAMFSFINLSVIAQVGIGTTNPDNSSMLDVQSISKGILVPRMSTAQRTAISSPATGLLVFDSTTESFWFRDSSGWVELVTDSQLESKATDELEDDDADTRVDVEHTPDNDNIRFMTQGDLRMRIAEDGVIYMGDSINGDFTKITEDGSLSFEGEATRWEDLKVPVNSVKIKDKKDGVDIIPAQWDNFIGETGLLWFEDKAESAEQSVTFTVQMPHAWKEGSTIYPHVHWTTSGSAPGSARVTWGLEYTWAVVGNTFPTETIITGTTVATPNSGSIADEEHIITPLGSGISATGKTLSSMLVCRLFRNSSATSDDYTGNAGLLEIDFHYQVDSAGSNEEYIKN